MKRMVIQFKQLVAVVALVTACGLASAQSPGSADASSGTQAPVSHFGICGLNLRWLANQEHDHWVQAAKATGVGWVREDLRWDMIQNSEGGWDFSVPDHYIDTMLANGIEPLIILNHNHTRHWSKSHVTDNLPRWLDFVSKVVSRYKDKVTYWEVLNEPDLEEMWLAKPSPDQYARVFTATSQVIRQADPNAKILTAGLACGAWTEQKLEYIRALYQQAGADAFDVISMHRYTHGALPEEADFLGEMQRLRQLMGEYSDAEKPIWITEVGVEVLKDAIDDQLYEHWFKQAAKQILKSRAHQPKVVVFHDTTFPGCKQLTRHWTIQRCNALGWIADTRDADALMKLTFDQTQILIMPQGEQFPAQTFPVIEQFIRDGGLVITLTRLPFYYGLSRKNNTWQVSDGPSGGRNEAYYKKLHARFTCSWRNDKMPGSVSAFKIAQWDENKSQWQYTDQTVNTSCNRFFTDAYLKGNDRLELLLSNQRLIDKTGERFGPVVLYDYDSDLTGGLLVLTNNAGLSISEPYQAMAIPRNMVMYRAAGAQKVFLFELVDRQADQSTADSWMHHLGVMTHDQKPRESHRTLRTMCEQIADASFVCMYQTPSNHRIALFQKPDKSFTAALWAVDEPGMLNLNVTGQSLQHIDENGEKLALPTHANGKRSVQITSAIHWITHIQQLTPDSDWQCLSQGIQINR